MDDLPPNHHADYRQFGGVFGYLAGLTMIAGRGSDAELVVELGHVGPDDHVVDIGCGPGTAVRKAGRRHARVTGVDPAQPMLHLAKLITRLRPPAAQMDWVCAGAERMPLLLDDTATVCWSIASVHHWPDLDRGLDEVERILAPGGIFLAVEKRVQPGATGNASHGWTAGQAERFATMLGERGMRDPSVENHDRGRRQVVVVSARR